MNYKIIVLLGTVGAGKTTQGRILKALLQKHGIKSSFTIIKTYMFTSLILIKIIYKLICIGKKSCKKIAPMTLLLFYRKELLLRIFCVLSLLDLIDIIVLYLFRVYVKLKLGFILIIEEYLPAIIADYLYFKYLGFSSCLFKPLINLCLRLYTAHDKYTCTVFLDASDNILVKRWKIRASAPVRPLYLKMQRKVLIRIINILSKECYMFIDTSSNGITKTALTLLNKILKR